MNTQLSEIIILANGYRGGFDVSIMHLPNDENEHATEKFHCSQLQEVEAILTAFRMKYNLQYEH